MKLSRRLNHDNTPNGWCHWCPACEELHCFTVEGPGWKPDGGPKWKFDGNEQKPTFHPSMLIFSSQRAKFGIKRVDKAKRGLLTYATREEAEQAMPKNGRWAVEPIGEGRVTHCHYHLVNGMINYCSDSPKWAGKSVSLPDIPGDYFGGAD